MIKVGVVGALGKMGKEVVKTVLNVEETIYSIGVDIAMASSIVNYIDLSLNDNIDVSKMDIANLTLVLKKQISHIKDKFEQLECIFKV